MSANLITWSSSGINRRANHSVINEWFLETSADSYNLINCIFRPVVIFVVKEYVLKQCALFIRDFLTYFYRPHIKDIFQSIAAKVGTGEPCCDWVSTFCDEF